MRYKKFFAGMTAAALLAGMISMLPAAAKDMPLYETLLTADGDPVMATAKFSSGDGSVRDFSSSVKVVRGQNKLRIVPKNADYEEERGTGASIFCIDFGQIAEQYPDMMIEVTNVALIKKLYNEDGEPSMYEYTDPETGETVTEQNTWWTPLPSPNPVNDKYTALDYSKILTGSLNNAFSQVIEIYNENGATADNDPFTCRDLMEYDYIDVTFFVWDDMNAEKEVFDNYSIPTTQTNYNDEIHETALYVSNYPDEYPSMFGSCWDSSTITGITYYLKVDEEEFEEYGYFCGAVGTNGSKLGWDRHTFSTSGVVTDQIGNYIDSNSDGFADTDLDPFLANSLTPIKVKDGLYAVTIVNEDGFFDQFGAYAQLWMQNWTLDTDGSPIIIELDHIVLNPSPEETFLNDRVTLDGTVVKQSYTKPKWEDFNKPEDEPADEPTDEPVDEPTTNEESSTTGDIDGNGSISVTDISKAAGLVKGKHVLTEEQYRRADVNKDLTVNVTDIILIAAHVKGKKSLFERAETDIRQTGRQ